MGCGCKERGKALSNAVRQAKQSDYKAARQSLTFVGKSLVSDAQLMTARIKREAIRRMR
jgi:hypothetical protein